MNNPLVQPDPGLYIWTLITFLVLLTLLAKFAWKPLLAALRKREEMIRDSLDEADRVQREMEQLQEESKKVIAKAQREAESIVARAKTVGEKARQETLIKTKQQANAILAEAEEQIHIEKNKAIAEIKSEVVNLSLLVASKLIRKNLTREANQVIIEESLRQIESPEA
ncbi:MAG: F0F1 ATP synthase subunit B [Acidobacteriota bacterium]